MQIFLPQSERLPALREVRSLAGPLLRTGLLVICTMMAAGGLLAQTPDAQAKFRLAQGFEQNGEYERAAEIYADLLKREPGNFAFFDGLQRMYVQLKQYDNAVAVIRNRLALMPNDATLYGMLGTAHYRAGREKDAMQAWERAIAEAPDKPQSYRMVANLMIENRLLDKAADIYRRGRTACQDPNLFTIELAQLLIASLDYGGATEEFLRWLVQNPAQIGYVETRLSTFTYKDEGRAEAIRVVQAHLHAEPTLRLYELLAWLHMEGKEFDRAFEVYRQIDELSNANGTAILGFADRVFRERSYDVAARAYRESLGRQLPAQKVPQARYGLACATMELEVESGSGDLPVWAQARSLEKSRARLVDAQAAFSQLAADYPQTEYSAKSLYQIGLLQLRYFQDLDQAARTFQQVLAEPAARPSVRMEVQLRMAELLVARAETTNAAAALGSIAGNLGATPDQVDEAQLRLAELAFFSGRTEDALRALATISTNVNNDFANDALELQALLQEQSGGPPQAIAQYGRAEFLARQHRNTEAADVLKEMIHRYPASSLADDALLRIGSLLTLAGRYQEAVAAYEQLLSEYRDKSKMLDYALFRMGEIQQFALAQPPQAIASYDRLLSDYPQSVLADRTRKRVRLLRGESL